MGTGVDPAQLPSSLHAISAALDVVTCRPDEQHGWSPHGYPDAARCPVIAGAPPYDGIYRGSWLSPGIFVRVDLSHASISPEVRAALGRRYPAQVGGDGAFYEYGIASSSQRTNRDAALISLDDKLAAAVTLADPSNRG